MAQVAPNKGLPFFETVLKPKVKNLEILKDMHKMPWDLT